MFDLADAKSPKHFPTIENAFDSRTIDLFAQSHKASLPRFSTNALAEIWTTENAWANPPFQVAIFDQIIIHLEANPSAELSLLVPNWPSKPWFKRLWRMRLAEELELPQFTADLFLRKGKEIVGAQHWKKTLDFRTSGCKVKQSAFNRSKHPYCNVTGLETVVGRVGR